MRLTPAGERIYPLIRQVLSASQALDREVALINSHKEDTIRVAAYSSIAMHWLPEVIQQFRRIHPELTVDIQMGSVEEVYRWVREDKADMGFASLQDGMTMDWLPLAEDPLLAILPPEYDLGRPGAVRRAGFQRPRVSDALHGLPPGHSPGLEPLPASRR